MAINLIPAPTAAAPNAFAAPTVQHIGYHAINVENMVRISGGKVKLGSLFCIGGSLYCADADTDITGTNALAIAVKFTVSGSIATPSYATSLTGVTWNGSNHGWYDGSGNLYIILERPGDNVIPGCVMPKRHMCYQTNGAYYGLWYCTVGFSGTVRIRYTINTNVSYGIAVRVCKNDTSQHEQYRSGGWSGDEYYDMYVDAGDIISLTWASTGNDGQTTGYIFHPAICHEGDGQQQLLFSQLQWWD
jgi:hypothetical protein